MWENFLELTESIRSEIQNFVLSLPYVEDDKNLPYASGIYFIYDKDKNEIIYVGQSVQLNRRFKNHFLKKAGYMNIKIYYLNTTEEGIYGKLKPVEAFFICGLRPKENISVNTDIKF